MVLTREQIEENAAHYQEIVPRFSKEEDKLQSLPGKFADDGWTNTDIEWIIEWKSHQFAKTNIQSFRENLKHDVRKVISETITTENPTEKVQILTGLKGVRVPTASAILLFMSPYRFTVVDKNAWGTLYKHEYLSTAMPRKILPNQYFNYLTTCQKVASEFRISLRELDRALWVMGR